MFWQSCCSPQSHRRLKRHASNLSWTSHTPWGNRNQMRWQQVMSRYVFTCVIVKVFVALMILLAPSSIWKLWRFEIHRRCCRPFACNIRRSSETFHHCHRNCLEIHQSFWSNALSVHWYQWWIFVHRRHFCPGEICHDGCIILLVEVYIRLATVIMFLLST